MVQHTFGQQSGLSTTENNRGHDSEHTGKFPEDIEQVLWWLPETTEAIIVSRGNVPVKKMTGGNSEAPMPPANYVPPSASELKSIKCEYQDLMAMECITPLRGFNAIYPVDNRNTMIRSFYGPKMAGLFVKAVWWDKDTTRENCDIIIFRDNTAARIIYELAKFPNKPQNIAGVPVIEIDLNYGRTADSPQGIPFDFDDPAPTKPNLHYLAAPHLNVYIATTNRELMKVVIGRMRQRGAKRAFPPNLPEWQHLDPTALAWGLRHYRRETADKDCLSMLKWDPGAKGLIFFGGNKPSQFIGLKYMSTSRDAGNRFSRMQADWMQIRSIDGFSPMNRLSADCVESRAKINVSLAELESTPLKTFPVDTTFMFCMNGMYLPWMGFSCPKLTLGPP